MRDLNCLSVEVGDVVSERLALVLFDGKQARRRLGSPASSEALLEEPAELSEAVDGAGVKSPESGPRSLDQGGGESAAFDGVKGSLEGHESLKVVDVVGQIP